MLAPLDDNGGPTMTHALLVGSPALDKGGSLRAGGMGPDVLIIEREDGSAVAVFSRPGYAKAAVEEAA